MKRYLWILVAVVLKFVFLCYLGLCYFVFIASSASIAYLIHY
jgi:hypothetical protein